MRQCAGAEAAGQVGAIEQHAGNPRTAGLVTIDLDVRQWGAGRGRLGVVIVQVRRAEQVFEVVVRIAQGVREGDVIAEIMLDARGRDIDLVASAVVIGQPVVVVAIDGRRRPVDEGNAIVREVVFFLVKVGQGQARGRVQTQAQRWGDAVAAIDDQVAVHDAGTLVHQGHAQRVAVVEGPVEVARGALQARRAAGDVHRSQWRQQWLLADGVDDPGRGAAAEQHGRGAQ